MDLKPVKIKLEVASQKDLPEEDSVKIVKIC